MVNLRLVIRGAQAVGTVRRRTRPTVSRIVQTAMMFGPFPLLGCTGQVAGTREFSVVGLPYVVVYAIASESDVDVSTVVYARRRYP